MVLGVAVLGAVLSSVSGPDGFRYVFVVAALVAVLAAVVTAAFIRPARD